MFQGRLTLAAAALCVAVGIVAAQQRQATPLAPPKPAPGQLEILDKQGKPAGLCPLKHTDVKADIAGYVARVTVTQQFANPSREPIEALYTFPLPNDAAVDDMTMTIGTRLVKGRILPKEEARAVYEAAKSNGQAAALLDQERPNIFTQSVANIMPGDAVKITISYVNLLKYQDGKYEFSFPMVVGPRYVPAGGYSQPGQRGAQGAANAPEDPGKTPTVTDAHKITPPITPEGTRAGHDISLTVNLDAGLPLSEMVSVLHPVEIRLTGQNSAVVKLKDQATIPNKDFVFRYKAAGSDLQSGFLTYSPQRAGGYFTLILQPPAAPPQDKVSPKEMVFVIDQTGSQAGWPLEKAKETMRHCIRNLNPGDTFQLLAFNTSVYPCFQSPVPANPATIQKALDFMKPLEGNGGTDILKAVDYALTIPDDPERLRIVCYMTDGYVGNDMQIIDYIGKHRGRARMFPFGVGNSVNRFLIDGMAREGCGVAEYVTVESNAGPMMGTANSLSGKRSADAADVAARFYDRIASPLLLNPTVDWHDLPVTDVYPKHIPDVFSAGPIILKGRFLHPGKGQITVHGLLRGKPWSQTISVDLGQAKPDGSAIATLWAREKIEDLQNQDWIGAQTGHPVINIKDQITSTALEYRLMSQYTSFVAVEERLVNVGGKQRTVDVPVEMPEGVSYAGIFGETQDRFATLGRAGGRSRGQTQFGLSAGAGGGYGFGGGVSSMSKALQAAPVAGKPVQLREKLAEKEEMRDEVDSLLVLSTDKNSAKKLAALTPEQRAKLLREAKLGPGVQEKANGKKPIEVQIWLGDVPADFLAKLKAAGFDIDAELRAKKLLLGRIDPTKLDALLELTFVRRVESPRIK